MFRSEAAVSQELKVVYLDISGFAHANHFEVMDNDYNLKETDLNCVAESEVFDLISSHRLAISVSTFVSRLHKLLDATGIVLHKK